ncbi:MAG: hypothetical protein JKX76_02355 [Colwellia sp.]|nr:hypothetical protein [Colwellia sp.]
MIQSIFQKMLIYNTNPRRIAISFLVFAVTITTCMNTNGNFVQESYSNNSSELDRTYFAGGRPIYSHLDFNKLFRSTMVNGITNLNESKSNVQMINLTGKYYVNVGVFCHTPIGTQKELCFDIRNQQVRGSV